MKIDTRKVLIACEDKMTLAKEAKKNKSSPTDIEESSMLAKNNPPLLV